MKKLLLLSICMLVAGTVQAIAADDSSTEIENTDVVATGTYQGIALRVDDDEKEVYVKTKDGKILELYFKKDTKLLKDGKAVEFSELEKGQPLEVKVEKTGNHLKPLEVVIKSKE